MKDFKARLIASADVAYWPSSIPSTVKVNVLFIIVLVSDVIVAESWVCVKRFDEIVLI